MKGQEAEVGGTKRSRRNRQSNLIFSELKHSEELPESLVIYFNGPCELQ